MKTTKAFTLIELVIVMAIISILSVMIIGTISVSRRSLVDRKHRNNARAIQVGMEKFYAANRKYPVDNVTTGGILIKNDDEFAGIATKLNVQLEPTSSECDTLGVEGGGKIGNLNTLGTQYSAQPYKWDCLSALGDTYSQVAD